jgi:L-lactate utilization protein LutB
MIKKNGESPSSLNYILSNDVVLVGRWCCMRRDAPIDLHNLDAIVSNISRIDTVRRSLCSVELGMDLSRYLNIITEKKKAEGITLRI